MSRTALRRRRRRIMDPAARRRVRRPAAERGARGGARGTFETRVRGGVASTPRGGSGGAASSRRGARDSRRAKVSRAEGRDTSRRYVRGCARVHAGYHGWRVRSLPGRRGRGRVRSRGWHARVSGERRRRRVRRGSRRVRRRVRRVLQPGRRGRRGTEDAVAGRARGYARRYSNPGRGAGGEWPRSRRTADARMGRKTAPAGWGRRFRLTRRRRRIGAGRARREHETPGAFGRVREDDDEDGAREDNILS